MKLILKRGMTALAAVAAVTVLSASVSNAAIVGVSNHTSTLGAQAEIIDPLPYAPYPVLDDSVTNSGQQGINERQNVLLTADLDIDGPTDIAAGTRVNSHLIFFNQLGSSKQSHANVEWTFSGKILGVMSDTAGNLESASNSILGNPNVTYPGSYGYRGLEGGGDEYSLIDPYTLSVSMYLTQPGDWIRVVTAVPLPAALPLYGAGMALLGFIGWRRKQKAAATA